MFILSPEGVFVDVMKTDEDEPQQIVRTIVYEVNFLLFQGN